jgi:aryl sulfotransferase
VAVIPPARRYTSPDEDSARWDEFPRRPGDIVISTRTKHGTTWTQMICALLVFGTPDLPGPIADLSPWLDWTTQPAADVYAALAAQDHRRFIKTHTPLAGLPLDPRVTYVVVARHPLDAAVSLYHQRANIDRVRWAELTGNEAPDPDAPQPTLHDALVAWIDLDLDQYGSLDFLNGVVHHYSDAWDRRAEPNVVLVHYEDLQRDLDGEMRRLAGRLGIAVDESTWPALVGAAGFDAMRARSDDAVPDRRVLKSSQAFFRAGRSGDHRGVLSAAELAHYDERIAAVAPDPAFRTWLHSGAGTRR